MNEEDMKKLFNLKDEYDMIVVQVYDSNQAEDIAKKFLKH